MLGFTSPHCVVDCSNGLLQLWEYCDLTLGY